MVSIDILENVYTFIGLNAGLEYRVFSIENHVIELEILFKNKWKIFLKDIIILILRITKISFLPVDGFKFIKIFIRIRTWLQQL